jgi:hypothetical protein
VGLVGPAFLVAALSFLVPLFLWVLRLRRRRHIPMFAALASYALLAAALLFGLAASWGMFTVSNVDDQVADGAVDPSQKARILAEGISESMHCAMLVGLALIGALAWILLAQRLWRPARSPR